MPDTASPYDAPQDRPEGVPLEELVGEDAVGEDALDEGAPSERDDSA